MSGARARREERAITELVSIRKVTIMRNHTFLIVALGLGACGAPDPELESGQLTVEHSTAALESDKPDLADYPAAVRLTVIQGDGGEYSCSGSLIAPDMIMTAAHCVKRPGIGNGGPAEIRVETMMWADGQPRGVRRCLTANSLKNNCGSSDRSTVVVRWDPAYRGTGDTESDAAVLKLVEAPRNGYKRPFFGGLSPRAGDRQCENAARYELGKPECFFRIYNDTFSATPEMRMLGWGYAGEGQPSGSLNWGTTDIDRYEGYHFFRDVKTTDQERMCRGDSGGPAAVWRTQDYLNSKYEYLLGVASNVEDLDGNCSNSRDRERWNRSGPKIWLVTNSPNDNPPGHGRECNSFETNSGHRYAKCWDAADW
jgi:hypothetical protein